MNDKAISWVTLGISIATLIAVMKIAGVLQKTQADVGNFTSSLPDPIKKFLGV